jgi:hypothetical protein
MGTVPVPIDSYLSLFLTTTLYYEHFYILHCQQEDSKKALIVKEKKFIQNVRFHALYAFFVLF